MNNGSIKGIGLNAVVTLRVGRKFFALAALAFAAVGASGAQAPASSTPQSPAPVTHRAVHSHRPATRTAASEECSSCVRQNLTYLAGPALQGRGSGTENEHRAAEYIAEKLKAYGLSPAAENGAYIQEGTIQARTVTAPPTLSFDANPGAATLEHGKQIEVYRLSEPDVSGPLQKVDLGDAVTSPSTINAGSVLLLKLKTGDTGSALKAELAPYLASKAAAIVLPEFTDATKIFGRAPKLPRLPKKFGDEPPLTTPALVVAKSDAFKQLWQAADGTILKLHADVSPWTTLHTWNVLAKLYGTTERNQIVLLSAHLDHLGVKNGQVYPGADDDASGTAAVMELARALAQPPRLRRTIVVALWGSEELGLVGSQYFLRHPTFDLQDVVANLEFEMIGRADSTVKEDQLWLTGWDKSNLGPQLAAHGAQLVADPHPEQGFFARSDNFALAKKGIVAQTVSSYGLHPDYHQPGDTVDKIDWQHLNKAIASIIGPIRWLANTDFQPQWANGEKP